MYNFELNIGEKIELISDNTMIYNGKESRVYTGIITNQRLLILDYPSNIHNSLEDLRISNKIYYIRKKEVIESINLKEIQLLK